MDTTEKARNLLEEFDRQMLALQSEFRREEERELRKIEMEWQKFTMQMSKEERESQPFLINSDPEPSFRAPASGRPTRSTRGAGGGASLSTVTRLTRKTAKSINDVMVTPIGAAHKMFDAQVLITPKVDVSKPIPISKVRVAQEDETLFSLNGSPVIVKATPKVTATTKKTYTRTTKKK